MSAERILVIAPNWIGDAVMAQALLALLKQQRPQSQIDVLAVASVAPVLRAMIEVDTVMETPFKHGALQLRERWRFARELKRRNYAAAYVLPNTLKFALIPWMAGIPRRVGYKGESRYGLINIMHHDDKANPRAMVAFYAALAFAPTMPYPSSIPRPHLQIAEEDIQCAMTTLELDQNRTVIAFAPGAEFGPAKRWPSRHFANLAHQISRLYPATQIVLLGSPKDTEVCTEIHSMAPQVVSLAGKTNLSQAMAILARAQVVVANDSGLLHIASALNRPVIALYGPTDPDHAPPFSDVAHSLSLRLECSPCKQRECPLAHQDCMQKLNSELAWKKLGPLLQA